MNQHPTSSSITPVLIVGLNRNGTTWLGNILSQCFDITAARHELHYGFCETDIYQNAKYWGDFKNLDNYINCLETYSKGDIFKVLEGDQAYFREYLPTSFYDFFFTTIDNFAQKQNHRYWVIKLDFDFFKDTDELEVLKEELNKRYKSVKYISIQRDFNGYINSYINMIGDSGVRRNTSWKKKMAGVTGAMFYYYFYRRADKLLQNKDVLKISYQSLKQDFETNLNEIKTFINYEGVPKVGALKRNIQNTSFTTTKKEHSNVFIRLSSFVFKYFPPINNLAVRLRYRFKKKNTSPPVWWRLNKAQYFKQELREELKQTKQLPLLEYMDSNDKESQLVESPSNI